MSLSNSFRRLVASLLKSEARHILFPRDIPNGVNLRKVFDGVDANIHTVLQSILPDFRGFWVASEPNEEGISIFVHKSMKVIADGNIFIYRWLAALEGEDSRTLGRNLQYIEVEKNGLRFFISNFHGMWSDKGKVGTTERDQQTCTLPSSLEQFKAYHILTGDFNLTPETNPIFRLLDER